MVKNIIDFNANSIYNFAKVLIISRNFGIWLIIVKGSCSCKNLVSEDGRGNCKGTKIAKQGKIRAICYVNQPSYCGDLEESIKIPGEQHSAEACLSEGIDTLHENHIRCCKNRFLRYKSSNVNDLQNPVASTVMIIDLEKNARKIPTTIRYV